MASVLYNLAHIDFRQKQEERGFYDECLKELQLDSEQFQPMTKEQIYAGAYDTIKRMDKEKKRAFSLMMTKMSRSDGRFGARERDFVMEILDMCDLPFVHK